MNVLVPAVPGRFRITQSMVEDLIYDPVMGVWVFWRVRLDAFQAARMRYFWFTPNVEDSSGFSAAKTLVSYFCVNLRAVLLGDQYCMVIYPTFEGLKQNFWGYYNTLGTRVWQAQLGKMDLLGEEDGKANAKGAACWVQYFKNGSKVFGPAPNFSNESRSLAGLRTNVVYFDEINKIYATAGGQAGVSGQLLGRNTRKSYNQNHPVWCNHVLMTSTAELSDHPAYLLHQSYEREVRKGNPDYATVSWCYKDYSNLPTGGLSGKTFKEEYRQDKAIETIRNANTEEKFAAEGLGLWRKQSRGWYTPEMVDNAHELGRKRGLEVIIAAGSCPYLLQKWEVHFFGGIDPAPARTEKADDGTLAVLRAAKPAERSGESPADWTRDFVYARRIRGTDADGWAGIIHEKHQDFGFELICIDLGGGGQWIGPLLHRTIQKIGGVWRNVTPILPRHTNAMEGTPLYFHLSRGEEDLKGEQGLWHQELKNARGDDVLKNLANTLFQTDVEKGELALPAKHHELGREGTEGWGEEKMWASKCLTKMGEQLLAYKVAVDEQGNWRMTKNGQRIFFSEAMDDLHDAGRNADVAFHVWHRGFVEGEMVSREDEAQGCYVSH